MPELEPTPVDRGWEPHTPQEIAQALVAFWVDRNPHLTWTIHRADFKALQFVIAAAVRVAWREQMERDVLRMNYLTWDKPELAYMPKLLRDEFNTVEGA